MGWVLQGEQMVRPLKCNEALSSVFGVVKVR